MTTTALSVEGMRWLVTLHNGESFVLSAQATSMKTAMPAPRCAECGRPLRMIVVIPHRPVTVFDTS